MIESYAKWLVAHPVRMILVSILAVLILAGGTARLAMDQDYRVFFSEEFPPLEALDNLHDTYNKNDNVLMVLAWDEGGVFTSHHLRQVMEATREAWKIPFSTRVESITNHQYTYASGDDLVVDDMVRAPDELDPAALVELRRRATSDPLLAGRLVGRDGQVAGINVLIELPGSSDDEAGTVMAHTRELVSSLEAQYSGLKVYLTGIIPMNHAFPEATMADMSSLVPLMYLVIVVLIGGFLRSFWGTVGALFMITFSVLVALGLSGYLGMPITPPSASTPTMIMTLALADSVHFLTYMFRQMRLGADRRNAVIESLKANFQPMLLTSLAAAIGFLTMNLSESPPFRDLGNITVFGVMAAFLLSVGFLPALMCVAPVRGRVGHAWLDRAVDRIADTVVTHRNAFFIGGAGAVIVLGSFIPSIQLNDEWLEYFDESFTFRTDTEFAAKHLTGIYTIEYSLPAKDSGGITDPEYLQHLAAFAQWWRSQQPKVRHVSVLSDMLKRINMNLHGDRADYYRLPDDPQLAAQYLMVYEMSLPFGHDLSTLIDIDKSATRLVVSLDTVSTVELKRIEKEAAEWLVENAPLYMFSQGTSPTVMFAHISQRNIRQMLSATTIALVAVSIVLIYALRSIKLGAVSLVPNLAPAILGFGAWSLLVGEVGLATSIVAAMTIGIVIDDTVHFLSKYRRARTILGKDPESAVRYAFSTVGTAMLVTTTVLVAGFLVLSQSTFEMNAGMGLLTALILAIALVADFTLLPALLMWLENRQTLSITEGRYDPFNLEDKKT
ncbi:MAG: MMPL family transporter [Candidatus Thiodiazotropha sp. (ex Epidulcina cf. delphinae)]|nr:MMPL family transporter [Candidatus Thiodiazotropha sp. (ex Epidulcina cf. delphinae)]